MTLDEYRATTDRNTFYRLQSGEQENLLEDAIERIDDLEKCLKEIIELAYSEGLGPVDCRKVIRRTAKKTLQENGGVK